jgi:hypothetical protein
MKNLNFKNAGLKELSSEEMIEIDGGFIPLLIIGAALLLSSCTVNVTVGDNNTVNGETKVKADSTANGNSAGTGTGNNVGGN